MKRILPLLFLIPLFAQSNLPHGLTEVEKTLLDQIGSDRTITDPPDSIVFAPAEFDSVAGIIFAWESYTTLVKQMIKETAETDTAWVVVDGQSQQNAVSNELNAFGVNMDRVEFIHDVLNSVWMRDYGPWWIYQPDGSRAVIDLEYNRPRPLDDAFPEDLANLWNMDYYGLGLVEAGGNMLLDGKGAVLISDVIFDPSQGFNPDGNLTVEMIEDYFSDYFGVHKVIITDHLDNHGTGHIDMFVKVVNDTTIIVGEYESPGDASGDNFNICNQVANQLENETNGEGRPFNVIRMLMPPYDSGITYTYINSLFVNKKVYVPVYGFATDADVLAQYESILPGYEIIGYDCNQIITANGAIHCITMKVPSMIEIVNPCEEWATGDTNGDGQINLFDLLVIADVIMDVNSPGRCSEEMADVNGDGQVTAIDIVVLLNQILEW